MRYPWETEWVTVALSEHDVGGAQCGARIVLDEDGKLPAVIIMGSWVFVRCGDTDRYVAQTCSIFLDGLGYATPLRRIYHRRDHDTQDDDA